jgi:DNA-directed RNA polymerase specialized sigma24 family protein
VAGGEQAAAQPARRVHLARRHMVSPAAAASPPGPSRDEEVTTFFIAHRNELCGYLIRVCGCPEHEADDITQDAFLAVREQWGHVRGYEKPKAYLYKVAVNRFLPATATAGRQILPGRSGAFAGGLP